MMWETEAQSARPHPLTELAAEPELEQCLGSCIRPSGLPPELVPEAALSPFSLTVSRLVHVPAVFIFLETHITQALSTSDLNLCCYWNLSLFLSPPRTDDKAPDGKERPV